ncbi:MAG: hypothetical protein EHM13_04125, partial [Acidobacteria bacterium]
MTRHMVRLIWNRKRTNLLMMIEIFISFLVLVLVATFGALAVSLYQRPLGFEYEGVWGISLQANVGRPGIRQPAGAEIASTMNQVWMAVSGFPEVLGIGGVEMTPWENATWNSDVEFEGREVDFGMNQATDGFAAVMGLAVTSGRWFDRSDDASGQVPVVISEALAFDLFGTKEAAG